MQALPFTQAREIVLEQAGRSAGSFGTEMVPLASCAGRVLAHDIQADRSYPPLPRAIRDGFAVRAEDFPGWVRICGEVRAGSLFSACLTPGSAVEIMTGAPVPEGADAVVMVEHAEVRGSQMTTDRPVQAGDFIVPAGAECRASDVVVRQGTVLDFAHVAALATVGCLQVPVYRRPEAAILATGDELVAVSEHPAPWQIRNSNSHSLAAQVHRAGGIAHILPVAPDEYEATRIRIEEGLTKDILLLSGGVSAGRYDLVEQVLADLGAEFFFDRVLIQPGAPLVFGRVHNTFFFGLPGNPASTMVTFELFARAALQLLGGCTDADLPVVQATLRAPFRHKPGLTRFLPARLCQGELEPVKWQGSGDVFALARANAFLVAQSDRESWEAGERIEVLTR